MRGVKTTKKMTVTASDGYDTVRLRIVDEFRGDAAVAFEHKSGRNDRGSLILSFDDAQQWALEVIRFVEFARHEVEG